MARPRKIKLEPVDQSPQQLPDGTFKAVGLKQVGRNYVSYVLTIEGDKVIDAKMGETSVLSSVAADVKVACVENFDWPGSGS